MTALPNIHALTWDATGRLRASPRADGATADRVWYVYDGGGQRVRKVLESWDGAASQWRTASSTAYVGGLDVVRLWMGSTLDDELQTLHVSDGSSGSGGSGRMALVETRTVEDGAAVTAPVPLIRLQFDNHLGSACLETTADGQLLSYEEFHPYGTVAYSAGTATLDANPKRYRYSGKERDTESGLYYYGARYLAPWLGRWASPDPAGFVDGVNVYAFVRGRPSTGWDEEGRWEVGQWTTIEGILRSFAVEISPVDETVEREIDEPYPPNGSAVTRLAASPASANVTEVQAGTVLNPSPQYATTTRLEGWGALNVDYYEIIFDSLPPGHTNESLAAQMTEDFTSFFDHDTTGGVLVGIAGSSIGAEGPEEGDVFRFELDWYTGWEHLYVQTTTLDGLAQSDQAAALSGTDSVSDWDTLMPGARMLVLWRFTTLDAVEVSDPDPTSLVHGVRDVHPVAGNRVFGFFENRDGQLVFFTTGVDRTSSPFFMLSSSFVFDGADTKWRGMRENMARYVDDLGGSAEIGRTYSERFSR